MGNPRVEYDLIEAELQRLADTLYGAEPAAIQAESDRLRQLAEQIDDELWRRRAVVRATQLPSLVAGPAGGSSDQFRYAEQLAGQALNVQGTAEERIAEVERIMQQIGELSEQAPRQESTAILRLNTPLARLVEHLRQGAR
jgi:hypothetical protein